MGDKLRIGDEVKLTEDVTKIWQPGTKQETTEVIPKGATGDVIAIHVDGCVVLRTGSRYWPYSKTGKYEPTQVEKI